MQARASEFDMVKIRGRLRKLVYLNALKIGINIANVWLNLLALYLSGNCAHALLALKDIAYLCINGSQLKEFYARWKIAITSYDTVQEQSRELLKHNLDLL